MALCEFLVDAMVLANYLHELGLEVKLWGWAPGAAFGF
jgi:hypothetical protein